MRNGLLTATALLALSVGSASAGCADLVAELEGVIAAPPAGVSGGDLVNMQQMLDVGSDRCAAGDEAGATEMLSSALALAGS